MPMTCPKCRGEMQQYERSGVTVDQCADCRGIFLDRGELERLVDAETSWHSRAQARPTGQPGYRDYDSDEYPVVGAMVTATAPTVGTSGAASSASCSINGRRFVRGAQGASMGSSANHGGQVAAGVLPG
jgi:hypothetical protein